MVHLLHRLRAVDAPETTHIQTQTEKERETEST